MKLNLRTVGLASACLIAVPFVVGASGSAASAAPAAPSPTVVTSIGALNGTQAWNVGGDATTAPPATEVQTISPVTDPVNIDGSVRIATPASSDRAQIAHSLLSDSANDKSGLDVATFTSLSYQTMVAASATNPAATVLQLTMYGCDTVPHPGDADGFTTFNFEPTYNKDTAGHALAQGQWQQWNAISGNWWSTRQLNGIDTGDGLQSDPVSWADILTGCGAGGRAASVNLSLGSGAPGADGYADDVTLNDTTWDFAVTGHADFTVNEPTQLTVGDAATQLTGTVTNPADGPDYSNVRYDFTLSGITGLTPGDVTLEYQTGPTTWATIPLNASGGTLTGSFGPSTGFALPHSTSNATTFRVAVKAGSPTGRLIIDNQLNNVDATSGSVISTIAEHATPVAVVDQYVAVTPTRVVDTRTTGNALHNGPLAANKAYTLDLSKVTGVPLNEAAYAFNVTAVQPTGAGNLRIGPACASPNPSTSIVNYQAGKDVANDLVVSNLVNGTACNKFIVYSATAGAVADVVMDLQGYFSSASGFAGVTPARVVDTRTAQGGFQGPLPGGSSQSFQIANFAGVPADASAVAVNITAVHPGGLGNLRVYPDGAAMPTSSNVNYIAGKDGAAFAIVKLPANGKIDVYSANSSVDVVIDVFGFLPATTNVVTQSPVRVLDTRATGGAALVDGTPQTIAVGGVGGVPVDAKAVIVSLTAVHTTGSTGIGNLQAYAGGSTQPVVSNINYLGSNADVANMAIVPLSVTGTMTLATHGSTVNATVDVVGYIPAG